MVTMARHPRPVGVFGVVATQNKFAMRRDQLLTMVGQLPEHEADPVAGYLRSGAIVMPIMEQSRDIIGGQFSVPGGSAILTDGAYYWRCDTAEYVQHYRLGLPADFVSHGRATGWQCPAVDRESLMAIEQLLAVQWGQRPVIG